MKLFNTIQQVSLPPSIAIKAWQFAKDVTLTTDYSDTNQTKINKIRIDHFASKLGEEAVYTVLSQYGKVLPPNYTVYSAQQKSWADDLYFENTGIAVKTMLRTAAQRFGLSWVFQASYPRRDIILDEPDAWVIFVECDDAKTVAEDYRLYVYPPYQIKELGFAKPVLEKLIGHKLVVYAGSLPKD